MERELACEIVKDLLPLYVDGIVSDVSKKSIENHLEHCTDCKEVRNGNTADRSFRRKKIFEKNKENVSAIWIRRS